MIRSFCLIIILVLCIFIMGYSQVLRVSFFELSPHIYSGGENDASGPALSYFIEIANRMNVRLAIDKNELPLSRLIASLEEGKIDVILALGRNPERESALVFPRKPFYIMKPSIMVLKSSPVLNIKSIADLIGMRVGIWQDGYLSAMIKSAKIQLVPLSGNQVVFRNYSKMKAGRIDAVYSPDEAQLFSIARQNGFMSDVRILQLPEDEVGLFTVFSKHVDQSVVKKYQEALETMPPYLEYLDRFLISQGAPHSEFVR